MTERLSRMAPPLAFQKPLSEDPQQHKSSLWVDEEFENLRSELFEAALTLHAATLGAQSDWAKKGFRAVGVYLTENAPSLPREAAYLNFSVFSSQCCRRLWRAPHGCSPM